MNDPIEEAAAAALRGDLIVFPTDTVYGIATRPDDPAAIARLFAAKARPPDLELPVLVPTAAAAREIAGFDARADRLAGRLWPGALTIVLPRIGPSRRWELGGDPDTIGVRVPHHPVALDLLARTGPLAVTSANRSGQPTPEGCDELRSAFGDAVARYVCEERPASRPASTVVDLAHGELRILREGEVDAATVRATAEPGPSHTSGASLGGNGPAGGRC